MKTINILVICMIMFTQILAQKGTIRGTIYDESNGEKVMFANVFLEGTDLGTSSDLEGIFSMQVPTGIFNLRISFMGYRDHRIENIAVTEGATTIIDVNLEIEGENVEEVIVSAQQLRNTESALMTIQKKSANVVDGISAQSFNKIGDSDAGEAIKRVTGVTVEGGKYVFVRGLGDRYNKTLYNNLGIPGLDPDRNAVEMDMFPNNLIDNIIVYKTFTPNLPGDFTGGVINVTSKDFPNEKTIHISAGVSYYPQMSFNPHFLNYKGGQTDWLGMDDGTRKLPFGKQQIIPDISNSENNELLPFIISKLDKNMGAKNMQNNLDKSISFSAGNQHNFGRWSLGYLLALNYKNGSTMYNNAIFQEVIIPDDQFIINRSSTGQVSSSDVMWNALAEISIKNKNHKFGIQYLRMQSGTSGASRLEQKTFETNPSTIVKDILEYEERAVSNYIFSGKHYFGAGKFNISWQVMPTTIEVENPDTRVTGFEVVTSALDGSKSYEIRPSVGAEINRAWTYLTETNFNSRIDLSHTFKMKNNRETGLTYGFLYTTKYRDFGINNYLFRVLQQSSLNLNGNPDAIFYTENIWTPGSNSGTYIRGNFEPANSFNAKQDLLAAYIMNDFPVSRRIKAIYGLRLEKVSNFYTGQSNDGQRIYDNNQVLDEFDLLPSLNLVYELIPNMNIRLSGSRTVARPTFKEKSLAQIQDRVSGRTFLGNVNLDQSNITNLDLRWEYFFNSGEMVSFSTFYKYFVKPIELVAYSAVSPDNFQPKNGEDTELYGLEFEIRKNLGFISTHLNGFNIGFNSTFVQSLITINNQKRRPLIGQSPFVINALIGYHHTPAGIHANLSYNLQAERLHIVGIGGVPDVYEKPFNSLNLKLSKKFGFEQKFNASLAVSNILDQSKEWFYKQEGQKNEIFQWYTKGRKFSFSLSYAF